MKLSYILIVLVLLTSGSENKEDIVSPAKNWIDETSGFDAYWKSYGMLKLPSGKIFFGDPSYYDEQVINEKTAVSVKQLEIWLLISKDNTQVHSAWLEADGSLPTSIEKHTDFGVSSAYFAFGDLATGQDIENIGDLNLPDYKSSFQYFLPHIDSHFLGKWLDIPPNNLPSFVVETRIDGLYRAVWTKNSDGKFSGILVNITGRKSDGLYLDLLIGEKQNGEE